MLRLGLPTRPRQGPDGGTLGGYLQQLAFMTDDQRADVCNAVPWTDVRCTPYGTPGYLVWDGVDCNVTTSDGRRCQEYVGGRYEQYRDHCFERTLARA